jgi:hypothetical protein
MLSLVLLLLVVLLAYWPDTFRYALVLHRLSYPLACALVALLVSILDTSISRLTALLAPSQRRIAGLALVGSVSRQYHHRSLLTGCMVGSFTLSASDCLLRLAFGLGCFSRPSESLSLHRLVVYSRVTGLLVPFLPVAWIAIHPTNHSAPFSDPFRFCLGA